LGFLGAHRFFVGKIVSGALYLVTMGFLGIGVLIDGILLMCRKFKDKEGNVI
jgi:TM2 domain-containing membrane protein YozV